MKKIIILFSILSAFVGANGQEQLEKKLQDLVHFNVLQKEALLNAALKNQSLIQVNTVASTDNFSNTIYSYQNQVENSASLNQKGTNHTTILFQNGFQNVSNIWSVGQGIYSFVYQDGQSNRMNLFVKNESLFPKLNLLQQYGSDNVMEIALLNGNNIFHSTPKVLQANQIGSGNHLELILESTWLPVVKVKQSGGMPIVIKQTDFYFPTR